MVRAQPDTTFTNIAIRFCLIGEFEEDDQIKMIRQKVCINQYNI